MDESILKDKVLIRVIGNCVFENNLNYFMAFVPVKKSKMIDKCTRALRRFGNIKKYGLI